MSFHFNIKHRVRTENMVVELRDYEIDQETEFLMETSRLRISSALDLNACSQKPVAFWQLPINKEWLPQRQVSVFPPETPVRVRIPKGRHRTLGLVLDKESAPRWSPTQLAATLRVAHEDIQQITSLILRELELDQAGQPDMIAGLSKLFTRTIGRHVRHQLNHSTLGTSHALVAWRMRIIEEATQQAATGQELDLDELAAQCRMSRQYLLSQYRRATGVSLGDQLWSARAENAKRLIEQGHSFSAIADQLNYSGLSHFSLRFSRSTGLSPSKYRQQTKQ